MVAAGTGNDQIMAAGDIRPLFEGDELVADISVEAEVTAKAQQESTRNPSTQEAGK